MALRRRNVGDSGNDPSWPFEGEALLNSHADLVDFLSATMWGDGASRVTGTLQVSVDAGNLRARLCDRDACQVTFLTADSWDKLLALCDAACRGEAGEWREDRFARPDGRKPKKG